MAEDNLAIWNVLGKTDPAHTQGFNRPGGFKGTAIKPVYTERKMTELFGPCGKGWGMDEPHFQVIDTGTEKLVFCTVALWYYDTELETCRVWGVGGDKVLVETKYGPRGDDEAFKKAYTDALGNAMKHLGMSADVHMGRFDDSKYVNAMRDEAAQANGNGESKPKSHWPAPRKQADISAEKQRREADVKEVTRHLQGIASLEDLYEYRDTKLTPDFMKNLGTRQIAIDHLFGEREAELKSTDDGAILQTLMAAAQQAKTADELRDWGIQPDTHHTISLLSDDGDAKFRKFYKDLLGKLKLANMSPLEAG